MSIATREMRASLAFVVRNFNLTRRYWGWEVAWLVYSLAAALAVAFIGVAQGDPELLQVLIIGTIFWNFLSIVFGFIGETVSWERWEGTLEYTFMAPVRRSTHLLGAVAYAMIFGLIHTLAILVAVVLFFPDISFAQANLVTIGGFMVLGSFSLVGVAMLAAILPLLFVERGMQMAFVLQSVILLVSGVYYTIDVLPGWMQVISWFSPATYALDGVRKGLIDGVALSELWPDIWPLLVMGTVFIPFGLWAFSAAERYAKRTGKLKRVG
jgi:ABC-2 type transport system permease protein